MLAQCLVALYIIGIITFALANTEKPLKFRRFESLRNLSCFFLCFFLFFFFFFFAAEADVVLNLFLHFEQK